MAVSRQPGDEHQQSDRYKLEWPAGVPSQFRGVGLVFRARRKPVGAEERTGRSLPRKPRAPAVRQGEAPGLRSTPWEQCQSTIARSGERWDGVNPPEGSAEEPLVLPKGLLLGVGTSAFQTEGAVAEDGRGPSIWDVYAHTPGRTHRGDTGDLACDSYHRMESDLDLIAQLGVDAYRFSVSWPRVKPAGSGPVNALGLDYYQRLVRGLRARRILPVVTLYHWDLPQALEAAGGWPARETARHFADYTRAVVEALGDEVGMWITINQPQSCASDGYGTGARAPGLANPIQAAKAAHHLLLGHAFAAAEIRAVLGQGARIGISLNLRPVRPLLPSDAVLAEQVACDRYATFASAVLAGRYPEQSWLMSRLPSSFLADVQRFPAELDFVGVNYYGPLIVTQRPDAARVRCARSLGEYGRAAEVVPAGMECSAMGTVVDPSGLLEVIAALRSYAPDVPVVVTECGYSSHDYLDPDGRVRDLERSEYLRRHLRAYLASGVSGAAVAGFFAWSLLDNFEWVQGYSQRFGLVYVEFGSQRRVPKDSAQWLTRVARSRCVDS